MNRRETTNHFSKEGKEGEKEEEKGEEKGEKKEQKGEEKEEELETFGCLNIVVCLAPQQREDSTTIKKLSVISLIQNLYVLCRQGGIALPVLAPRV